MKSRAGGHAPENLGWRVGEGVGGVGFAVRAVGDPSRDDGNRHLCRRKRVRRDAERRADEAELIAAVLERFRLDRYTTPYENLVLVAV